MGRIHYFFISTLSLAMFACGQGNKHKNASQHEKDSMAMREKFATSPVLDGKTAISKMQFDKGLAVQLVAEEPMVVAPVAMTFDERGRMWVVEMTGFMPDTAGTGEDKPDGKIVILEDTTGDGVMDKRTVFLDSLVLPRAVCLVENGVLVATPPQLWFIENNGDKPGKRTLVDDQYAAGGNVEHQPNGLFRAMDNWIYNAKSDRRYRKVGDKWLKENTHFRGQWGVTQDDQGRLYYNNNSENLLGDYFPPGLGSKNPQQQNAAGYDEKIVPDNHVYPIRATPGVNRGYQKGVLDDSLRLVEFTAACGPLIYRGGLLPAEYAGNAFVAEPSANLIKRNLLSDSSFVVKGVQAYKHKEFLASTDERFRPTGLYTGPDGAIYIPDMYRGILQHKTYLTPYLKNEIKTRNLTQPLNCGRIYRIIPAGAKPQHKSILLNPDLLRNLLHDANGALRDKAQQLIIDHQITALVPGLKEMLKDTRQPLAQIHALWTLEGLHHLTYEDIAGIWQQPDARMKVQALATLPSILNSTNVKAVAVALDSLSNNPDLAPVVGYLLPAVSKLDKGAGAHLEDKLIKAFAHNRYVSAAVVNNATNREAVLLKQVIAWNPDTTLVLRRQLEIVLKSMANKENAKRMAELKVSLPRGYKIFNTVCQTCHGKNGDGIASMAPPLNESNWVNGNKKAFISIVLYGLTGPVEVHGKMYKAPEINGDMPGIGGSDEFNDADIAQLLTFLRSSWNNKAGKISEADIQQVRKQYNGRQKPFTAAELGN
ncbi:glucose/arabinose dehydrogenase [Chitinophaga niastensis]|uniref:Glucose/arabinose dehydrogenase n=2 Tax=Chitinophaga niastensis TaxID=536980 RepID=A0A2P8HFG1_CHINA|nr:glucose/arabinose dehydrogenase [Chitinophaga niastensis]